ncbi:MAG: hypothetical protein IJ343_00305 [Clostridia bacterium]|nr:hypothetical protein [Clostridia bacterium]
MKLRRVLVLIPLAVTVAVLLALPRVLRAPEPVPGLEGGDRTLLRIWLMGSPGGAQSWLTQQLRRWEKQHPCVTTYLRAVAPEEAQSPEAVLPDMILYMPGDLNNPAGGLQPLACPDGLREELLRCGRWQGEQLGLPLCWGAWVLAVDSALEPGTALTPAPTTLLGKPAATSSPTASPGYPLAAAAAADCPIQSPGGMALFSLQLLLPPGERPPFPDDLAQKTSASVYADWQARRCASAMLTTGQATAFTALVSGGKGFPFRILVPEEIVTDQVWLASLTADAPAEAASLLAFLTGPEAQQALAAQGLHTVRDDMTLYTAGFSARVEQAAGTGLSAVNAYLPAPSVHSAAWQSLQGTIRFSQALLPLL